MLGTDHSPRTWLFMRSIFGKAELVVCFTVAVTTAACGSATVGAPNPFSGTPPAGGDDYTQGAPDEIVRAEIQRRGGSDHTAMALIRRLRPAWLLARGQNSFTDPSAAYPIVYIDEIRHGNLSTLNQIPATEILSMRFFNTADATTRWGTGHQSGAINIVTGR